MQMSQDESASYLQKLAEEGGAQGEAHSAPLHYFQAPPLKQPLDFEMGISGNPHRRGVIFSFRAACGERVSLFL